MVSHGTLQTACPISAPVNARVGFDAPQSAPPILGFDAPRSAPPMLLSCTSTAASFCIHGGTGAMPQTIQGKLEAGVSNPVRERWVGALLQTVWRCKTPCILCTGTAAVLPWSASRRLLMHWGCRAEQNRTKADAPLPWAASRQLLVQSTLELAVGCYGRHAGSVDT